MSAAESAAVQIKTYLLFLHIFHHFWVTKFSSIFHSHMITWFNQIELGRITWYCSQHRSFGVAIFHSWVDVQILMLHRPARQKNETNNNVFTKIAITCEKKIRAVIFFYLELVLHLARHNSNWSETLNKSKLLRALASFNTDINSSFCKNKQQ